MILVVDDEEAIRRLVRAVLEQAEYDVQDAPGGDSALRVLETETPDLLLTDIAMPGMNGLKLAAHAHQLRPGLPVIFMSGYVSHYEQELSGSVCLDKPFTSAQLLAAVADVVDSKRANRT